MTQKIHSGLLILQPFVEVCYHAIVANLTILFKQMLMNARIILVAVAVNPVFFQKKDVSHSATTQWVLTIAYVLEDMFLNMMGLLVKVT